jgi:hypothetical protein
MHLMEQPFTSSHVLEEGKPAGGYSEATGIQVLWQNGPLGRVGSDERIEPNGAFVETVIAIAKDRIEFYQGNGFSCRENALAITKLEEAMHWLNARTQRRVKSGVEGTHEGN